MENGFQFIDNELYIFRSRSIRIMGHSTSLRIENKYWSVLESIAEVEEVTLPELISEIYFHATDSGVDYSNFASLLRLYCLQYMEEKSTKCNT